MARRSLRHRARFGIARHAHEAALRNRLPSSMARRSALEALLFVGFADRATRILGDGACRPWRGLVGFCRPRPCRSSRKARLGGVRDCAGSRRFPTACPRPWRGVWSSKLCLRWICVFGGVSTPSLARACRLRLTPALPSMARRSALKKLCFLPAAPTGPHPSMARREALKKLCFLSASPTGPHPTGPHPQVCFGF